MQFSLRNPVLATIIYYDCLDFPLTLSEVHRLLINPARISRISGGIGEIKLSDINDELAGLLSSKIIGSKNGFYFLYGRDSLCDIRIERQKISAQKWKKFLKYIKFLSLAPYLRGIFASGSMALNGAGPRSDFDILVIIKPGRLYTSRLFLWLISSLMGVRRKRHERVAPDKLCFNHYITEEGLRIKHESLFNAETYAHLKPAMIGSGLVDEFYKANLWINNYLYNFRPQKEFSRRSADKPRLFVLLAKTGELFLNSRIGNILEKNLKKYQQKRIINNPVTHESGGRIVYTDRELEFHPYSFEKKVLQMYKEKLRRYGIISFVEEKDSGLTR